MIDSSLNLPASLEAIRQQAAQMFQELDVQRARLFVQQIANQHGDDDVFETRPPMNGQVPDIVTYAQRIEELDRFEQNLRAGLPPAVIEAIEQNGKVG
jgi:hypothetical protein